MRLWTIQPVEVYKILMNDGIFVCDPEKSEFYTEWEGFKESYEWLVEQMNKRIGDKPDYVRFPIWARHTVEGKHKKIDLRKSEFKNYREPSVCMEVEIEDEKVLLSDERAWYFVLNKWFLASSDEEHDYFVNLKDELLKQKLMRKSWDKIFDLNFKSEDGYIEMGEYVQATFWELRKEQVKDVRFMKHTMKTKC